MLSLVFKVIKISLFSVMIVVLANVLYWDGRTLSDQVRHGLAQAKRVNLSGAGNWGGSLDGLTENAKKTLKRGAIGLPSNSVTNSAADLQPTERQKLRALIRELNTTSTP